MSSSVNCPHCEKTLSFVQDLPKFCSNCGGSLASTQPNADLDATQELGSATSVAPIVSTDVPNQIGDYRIVKLLGRGGMGTVYEAIDVNTNRHVALKILGRTGSQSSEVIERFKREGQIAASISHARSTFVYAAGQDGEILYIVMELMPGGTIKDEVTKHGPLPIDRAVSSMIDVIDGLEAAHRAGIIHRDIKPTNCFVEEDGRVKVGDFGLSKSFEGDTSLTRTGAFMGTPQFAATEQIRGEAVDERTDIYAIGCTLFYLLTGKPPFEGDFAKVIAGIASETAPNVRDLRASVPKSLASTVAQTLEKDPDKRPKTLNELRDNLLPFATQGSSFADLGRRVAAFFIDTTFLATVCGFFVLPATLGVFFWQTGDSDWRLDLSRPAYFVESAIVFNAIFAVFYYTLMEGLLGRSIGKILMGLRVTTVQGERPRMFRSLIRSLLLPGIAVSVTGLLSLFVLDISATLENLVEESARNQSGDFNGKGQVQLVVQAQFLSFTTWIVSSLVLLTIRKSNGYRGIHGLCSGTRVQRDVSREVLDRSLIPVVVAKSQDLRERIGNFEILGTLNQSGGKDVFLARDSVLDRNVWLTESDARLSPRGNATSRPAQQKWLSSFQDQEGKSWDVLESVRGIPFWKLLSTRSPDWPEISPLLAEVATEIKDSHPGDDSKDTAANINQIWIDENNQIKFVTQNLGIGQGDSIDESPSISVLNTLAEQTRRKCRVPFHFVEFTRELGAQDNSFESLSWASNQLSGFIERASKWKWDDRMGAIAISAGLEQLIFQAAVFLVAFLLGNFTSISFFPALTLLGLVMLINCFCIGFFFRGGLVFHIIKLRVTRAKDGLLASRLHCGIRNLIAWSPMMLSFTLTASWVVVVTNGSFDKSEGLEHTLSFAAGAIGSYPMMMFYLGALIAIFIPMNGLQDLVARTRLIRE